MKSLSQRVLGVLLLSMMLLSEMSAQSNQFIISTDVTRLKPDLAFNLNGELSLGRKISVFTDILYARRNAGVWDQIGVDSISFGFPVPIYERFYIDELWLTLGSNFFISKSKNYNNDLYFSSLLFYNKLVKTEAGFTYPLDQDVLGMGIGLGYQGRIGKAWSVDVGIRSLFPFTSNLDDIRIPGSDGAAYLRVGYILSPQSSGSGSRRRSSR